MILDSAANVVLSGRGTPTSIIGTFQILLNSTQTAKFSPGGYALRVIAYSWSVLTPRFNSRVFTALPPSEEIIGALIAELTTNVASVRDTVTGLGTTTDDIQARVTGLEGTVATLTTVLYIATALIVISIIVSVLMFVFMRRKP